MKFFNPPTRRLKFTDNSGYLKDRLVEIPHSSCPTHDAAADQVPKLHLWLSSPTADANAGAWGERRTDIPAGERPGVPRQREARQDQGLRDPTPFSGPAVVNEMPVASPDQSRAEPRPLYDEGTPPSPASTPSPTSSMAAPDEDDGRPLYPPHEWNRPGTELDELGHERWIRGGGDRRMIDARTVKISGTDQHGRLWSATTWGPYSERGEGASVDPIDPGEQRLTKQMARDGANMLRNLEHNSGNMVAGLRVLQARLSAHYRR
jgi:hypothetical protein